MAAVSVFVDDAVRGQLPPICVKTGERTDLIIRVQQPVGGGLNGAAWLLVFLGPPGWVALFVVMLLSSGQEYLTVRIPQTEAAYDREKALERFRLAASGASIVALLCGVVLPGMFPVLWLVAGAAFLIAAAALHLRIWGQAVGISLDGSRRWVTLSGVHPDFVQAVREQEVGLRRS